MYRKDYFKNYYLANMDKKKMDAIENINSIIKQSQKRYYVFDRCELCQFCVPETENHNSRHYCGYGGKTMKLIKNKKFISEFCKLPIFKK